MPTSMHVHYEIAKRFDPHLKNERLAIRHFYKKVLPTKPKEEQESVLQELLDREGEIDPKLKATQNPAQKDSDLLRELYASDIIRQMSQ